MLNNHSRFTADIATTIQRTDAERHNCSFCTRYADVLRSHEL
jgi:hypothetical protein